jgi:hypothetical protein
MYKASKEGSASAAATAATGTGSDCDTKDFFKRMVK